MDPTLCLSLPSIRDKAKFWIDRAPQGTRIVFKPPKRSLEQNALLWARLSEISKRVWWYDEKLTPDNWKDVFTAALRKSRVVPGLDGQSLVILGQRTSKMSKAEMGELLDLIDAFSAERGIDFKDTEKFNEKPYITEHPAESSTGVRAHRQDDRSDYRTTQRLEKPRR